MNARTTSASCGYTEGKPTRNGEGTRLVPCPAVPHWSVSVCGLSPLAVCTRHRDRMRVQFITVDGEDFIVTPLAGPGISPQTRSVA